MSRAQKIRIVELAGVVVLFSIVLLFLGGRHHPVAAAEVKSGSGYSPWISGEGSPKYQSGINTVVKSYYSRELNKRAMEIYKVLYKKHSKSGKAVKVKLSKKFTYRIPKSALKKTKMWDYKKVRSLDMVCDKATRALVDSNIDCYWIDYYTWSYHYTYTRVSRNKVKIVIDSIKFKPLVRYKGAREELKTVKAAAQKIAANIMSTRPDKTRFTTARLIYEYLIKLVSYGHNNGVEYSPASALLPKYNHISVCDGYARAFKTICDYCGVTCLYVGSTEEEHAWNMVQLENGKWYGVDVTWGDEGTTVDYRWFMYGRDEVTSGAHPEYPVYDNGGVLYQFEVPRMEPTGIEYEKAS